MTVDLTPLRELEAKMCLIAEDLDFSDSWRQAHTFFARDLAAVNCKGEN